MSTPPIDQTQVRVCEPFAANVLWRGTLGEFFQLVKAGARAAAIVTTPDEVRRSVAGGRMCNVQFESARCWLERDAGASPSAAERSQATAPEVLRQCAIQAGAAVGLQVDPTMPTLRRAASRAVRFLEDNDCRDPATQREVLRELRDALAANP